jgi:hypothetical protein
VCYLTILILLLCLIYLISCSLVSTWQVEGVLLPQVSDGRAFLEMQEQQRVEWRVLLPRVKLGADRYGTHNLTKVVDAETGLQPFVSLSSLPRRVTPLPLVRFLIPSPSPLVLIITGRCCSACLVGSWSRSAPCRTSASPCTPTAASPGYGPSAPRPTGEAGSRGRKSGLKEKRVGGRGVRRAQIKGEGGCG